MTRCYSCHLRAGLSQNSFRSSCRWGVCEGCQCQGMVASWEKMPKTLKELDPSYRACIRELAKHD